MALIAPRMTGALPPEDAHKLNQALAGSDDITVFVDGTVHRLPPLARDAVVDLLHRFSRGEAVTVSSVEEMLTTSKAAELAGISRTYLRNMTDRGEIPVEYRGSHRRIPLAAILAWLERQKVEQQKKDARKKAGGQEAPDQEVREG
ncbi:helix-turn-helix domain-containing protein [Arthrobacter sp. Cr_A7]|uniref:helix-turn-helix domain-containing protein n=1 Tax=Arthrobacter sp. Cr_A7 TaxID=3031017 RepID=UPI0023D99BFF|nr:helix-turn-helix domain-containing protein [Arthrobacter sp. Cr_A7]MDF2048798.1 helix-turn-helix domain-containing protein [Arthrobacter sp. Cr_A7]